jgi:hypothetical protein
MEVNVNTFAFVDLLGYLPETATEFFGIASMLCFLAGFYLYGKHVLGGRTKPNIATWGMWFFGEVVDLITYDSITGSHWTTNAGPFACMVGVFVISLLILVQHARYARKKMQVIYQPLEKSDKWYFLPDVSAFFLWLFGKGVIGNFISVGTSIIQYVPMYRETYRDPTVEHVKPWVWWSLGYVCVLFAVITGPGSGNWELYFLPLYYLIMDAVMVWLCLRKIPPTVGRVGVEHDAQTQV